jgi:hypothetical protein
MPSDDIEARRLNSVQLAVRTIFEGRNILPTISRTPSLIIDVGTGPGSSPQLWRVFTGS